MIEVCTHVNVWGVCECVCVHCNAQLTLLMTTENKLEQRLKGQSFGKHL